MVLVAVHLEKRHAMLPSCELQHLRSKRRATQTTEDFISELFYRVEEAMKDSPKHPLSHLWPSEIVTLGILFALKGVGNRAFYRWLHRDWRKLFPALPERAVVSLVGHASDLDGRIPGLPLGLGGRR